MFRQGQALIFIFIGIFAALAGGATGLVIPFPLQKSAVVFANQTDEDLMGTYRKEVNVIDTESSGDLSISKREKVLSKIFKLRNKDALAAFKQATAKISSANGFASKALAKKIFELAKTHPIVGLDRLPSYDPDYEVGFCFGRAAYVHLELLRAGVHPDNIAKVFVMGDLKYGQFFWEFHVATLARDRLGQWWAIDNLSKDVLSLEDWLQTAKQLSVNPKTAVLRFYFTDALKLQPSLGAYNTDNLQLPRFNNYFIDLMKWFQNHPRS